MPNYVKSSHGPLKNLLFIGHEDAEAYDKEAGAPDQGKFQGYSSSLLADADAAIVTWNCLPELGEKMCEIVEKETGIARRVNEVATKKAKERAKTPEAAAKVANVLETTASYLEYVFAQLSDEDKAKYQEKAKEVALTIKVDASPGARAARGPSKQGLEAADTVLALDADAREAKITRWNSALVAAGGEEFNLVRGEDGSPDRNSLAYFAMEVMKTAL